MPKHNYKELKGTDLVSDSFKQINDNTNALLTGFEGSNFPENPIKGQRCFMQDVWHTYNGEKWLADNELHNHDSSYYTKSQLDEVLLGKLPPVSDDVNDPTAGAVPTNAAVIKFVDEHGTIVKAKDFFATGLKGLQDAIAKVANGVSQGTVGSVKSVSPVANGTEKIRFSCNGTFTHFSGITYSMLGMVAIGMFMYEAIIPMKKVIAPSGGTWQELGGTNAIYAGGATIVLHGSITATTYTPASSAAKNFIKVA
jgi:hypothetical protein